MPFPNTAYKHLFKLLLLITQSTISTLATLSVNLRPRQETCFAFKTPSNESARISGNFDVYDDDLSMDPVTVVLFDSISDEVIWYNKKGTSEGSFQLVNSGTFHLCFGNGSEGYSDSVYNKDKKAFKKLHAHPKPKDDVHNYKNTDGLNRRIGFQIRVEPVEGTSMHDIQKANTESAEQAAIKQTNKLEDLTYQLRDRMELLLDHQEYIKGRESFHRHVVEHTFTMVMRWTLLEAAVLIFVACAQVFYLTKFFETKRYL